MTEWRVSGFEEVRELGRGAQGRVVLARHVERGTPVAIKYLPAGADPAAQERFRREARLLGQVDNAHVARLYRLVESDEGIAIIMEAVDGVSFKTILERYERLQPEAALTVLKGSLLGLAAAHAAGVVHRDYKPANVVVRADGLSKLIDFGVATAQGHAGAAGTPVYMAPEQWRGGPASPATDVYAVTCVFYESITGHRPYTGDNQAALMNAHLTTPVPLDDVPSALRPLVERGMAKEPAERPEGAAAFVGQLEEVARAAYGPDWESRGVRALAASALAFAALFPLAAAGLVPGASAGTAVGASSGGVITALGTKGAVAIAGTAVVGATAGGVGIYQAVKPEPNRRPVAATSSPAVQGVPITMGRLRLMAPKGWKVQHLGAQSPSYRVDVPGPCPANAWYPDLRATFYNSGCPSFAVLGADMLLLNEEQQEARYRPGRAFHPANDPGGVCVPKPATYRMRTPDKLLKKSLAQVGNRKADYYEWRFYCLDQGSTSLIRKDSFVQRTWYFPQSRILIVDEWNIPNLDKLLAAATWL